MMQFWKKTRRVFVIKLTIMTLVLALLGRGVFWLCCPEYYFAGFPLVPLFFYIYGLIYIFLFEFFGSHNLGLSGFQMYEAPAECAVSAALRSALRGTGGQMLLNLHPLLYRVSGI